MSPSEQFCDAQQWAEARFGRVRLGDVRRQRRVCTLVAGWVRQPGASMLQLGTGVAYASKAACHLPSQLSNIPDVLQTLHRQRVTQQLQQPGTYLLVEDTAQPRWSRTGSARPGRGPAGTTRIGEQGILLHSLAVARWPGSPAQPAAPRPAVALLGLLGQSKSFTKP